MVIVKFWHHRRLSKRLLIAKMGKATKIKHILLLPVFGQVQNSRQTPFRDDEF